MPHRRIAFVMIAGLLLAATAGAQTLDPRAYVASPIGGNFVVLGVTHSEGGVLVDPSLPVEDVHANAQVTTVGYLRTFSLFGRLASVYGVVPYAWGDVSGKIAEARAQTSRSGLADPVVRFTIHLAGNPAQAAREFAKTPKKTIVGASVTVAPPLGQYYPQKLINLGTNRWAFKPEIGVSHPIRRWLFDVYGALWLYTDNHEFYPGTIVREQASVASVQAHISYNLTLRGWAAFDTTWYFGGRTSLNGVPKEDRQNNARMGVTLSLPVGRRYSVKGAYSWGLHTTASSGFNTLSVGWNIGWLSQ